MDLEKPVFMRVSNNMPEAKPVLHPKLPVSIQTEFADNEDGKETEKQDCERKAVGKRQSSYA